MRNVPIHSFGNYLAQMRALRSVSSIDLANAVKISTAYLSQLEHGVRNNPESHLVLKIAEVLGLSQSESILLFDLYAEATGQLPPDITEYLTGNQSAIQALRQARDANVTEQDWEQFIRQLKK